MKDLPILDEAYMERRARQEAMRDHLRAMQATMDSLIRSYSPPKDEKTEAREAYLADEITLEVFEARLDSALGLKP